jgi:hypothetical protein
MNRISHPIILGFFLIFTLSNLNFAEAQSRGGGGRSSGGPGLLSGGLMVGMGQGQMGNGVDVANRTMIYTPITLFAGFNIKKFRIGANYEYDIVGQSDDPASFGNQNLSGKGSATGVRLDYWDGKQAFGIIYRMSDTFNADKPTNAGTTATYTSTGGYQVQYYRQIKKRIGVVLDYTTETFDKSLTNNIKWTRLSLGVVFTNFTSTGK